MYHYVALSLFNKRQEKGINTNYNFRKGMKSKLKLSGRTKVRLSEAEKDELKEYSDFDRSAYANIRANTGIHRDTIVATIERGWMMLPDAIKLRDYFKKLKEEGIFIATSTQPAVS